MHMSSEAVSKSLTFSSLNHQLGLYRLFFTAHVFSACLTLSVLMTAARPRWWHRLCFHTLWLYITHKSGPGSWAWTSIDCWRVRGHRKPLKTHWTPPTPSAGIISQQLISLHLFRLPHNPSLWLFGAGPRDREGVRVHSWVLWKQCWMVGWLKWVVVVVVGGVISGEHTHSHTLSAPAADSLNIYLGNQHCSYLFFFPLHNDGWYTPPTPTPLSHTHTPITGWSRKGVRVAVFSLNMLMTWLLKNCMFVSRQREALRSLWGAGPFPVIDGSGLNRVMRLEHTHTHVLFTSQCGY